MLCCDHEFAGPLAQGVSDNGHLFPLPSSHLLPHFPSSQLSTFHHLEVGSWKLEVGSWCFFVLEWAHGARPRGAIPAQSTTVTSLYGPVGCAAKSMLILMLFFDRFVLALGCLWGSFLVPFGALFAPS